MGANRPPAMQKKAYIEIDYDTYVNTGEAVAVGTPIIAPTITTKVPRGKFEITYTAELIGLLEKLGNKKIQVFSYLLEHKDGNNSIITSVRDLAKETDTSIKTVQDTLTILKDAGLLTRKKSTYFLSPHLMVKGNQAREAYLMRKYEEISEKGVEAYNDSIDATIDPQISFDPNSGSLYQKAK